MSENFSRVGRRKFLATAGIAATGSVLLKACVGNPPPVTPLPVVLLHRAP
jgi:bicarbonate transport system substrate-binding protein